MSNIQTIIDDFRAMKQEFQTKAQATFKEFSKEFFDKNPGINAVIWTQYTPYFNDGDTCEFSVNDATFTNAIDPEDLSEVLWGVYEGENEEIWADEYWSSKSESREGVDLVSLKEFNSIIQSGEFEDVMQEMFGDHVRVVMTREGFDVEEYEHE